MARSVTDRILVQIVQQKLALAESTASEDSRSGEVAMLLTRISGGKEAHCMPGAWSLYSMLLSILSGSTRD